MKSLTRVTEPTLDVLQTLLDSREPIWGLLLAKGTGRPPGTIYPILSRLENLGWVTGRWDEDEARSGPRRRLYNLTEGGAAEAARLVASRRAPRGIPRARPAMHGAAL